MTKHSNQTVNPLLKECLFTALILLMDQKDFKDIKISEIAQKAGVSRMTYYRTYDSKEDILIQYFEDQAKKLVKEMEQCPDITPEQFFTMFFTHFKDQAHLMHYMFKADLLKEICTRLVDFVSELFEKSSHSAVGSNYKTYEIRFLSGGLFMMMLHWIEREMPEAPEEMAKLTVQILQLSKAEA